MGVAPLVWEEIIKWAERFYIQDKIIMVPRKTTKIIEKVVRGRVATQIETVLEETPILTRVSSLEDYELEIIMQLSREYCDEYAESSDPDRQCPKEIFLDEVTAEDAIANANAIQDGLMSLFRTQIDTNPEIVRNT